MIAGRAALAPALARLRPLLAEINDLKRIVEAGRSGSLASRGFARAWAALAAGEPAGRVAAFEAASAVSSARLGAVGPGILHRVGLTPGEVLSVLDAAVVEAAGDAGLAGLEDIRSALPGLADYQARYDDSAAVPSWVGRLIDQPRAGATRPGCPRLILEPAEGHGDHCYITAAYAAIVAPVFGAEPGGPFLAGLAHHFHNAALPDSGFAGEELLGRHLGPIMDRLTAEAIGELPTPLADEVRHARRLLLDAETPEARAFHAADVLDRVLQMDYFARVSAFELRQALDDLDLVHPGPLQAFHLDVLSGAGLWG